jgi:hypothetical protein
LRESAGAGTALPNGKFFLTHGEIFCTEHFRNISAVAYRTTGISYNVRHVAAKKAKFQLKNMTKLADGFLYQSSFFNLTF